MRWQRLARVITCPRLAPIPFSSAADATSILNIIHTTQPDPPGREREKGEAENLISERSMMASSKDRDNFVYIAKLAEQAERYDGFHLSLFCLWISN